MDAVGYVGKDKAWLDRACRRPEFKRALEIRLVSSDEDVGLPLDADHQSSLRADIAWWVQSEELDRKERLSMVQLLVQMTKLCGRSLRSNIPTTPSLSTAPSGKTVIATVASSESKVSSLAL